MFIARFSDSVIYVDLSHLRTEPFRIYFYIVVSDISAVRVGWPIFR